MTEINSFKGIVFNPEKNKDLFKVFCPPYDVISKKDQEMYHKRSPENFIRIVLGKESSKDNDGDNKYTRAQETFNKWLKDGILIKDSESCLYFYYQEYIYKGEKKSRLGFIGLLKLQDSLDSKIFPHENTHSEPKEDRLQLIKKVKANLSPIFVLFSDKQKMIQRIFDKYIARTQPFIDILDVEETKTKVWRLTDEETINRLKEYMQDKSIFIADGHHRYEVAQTFLSQLKKEREVGGKEDFNYIMAYFTDLDSRDLQILPIHRVIRKASVSIEVLKEYFSFEKVKDKYALFILLRKAGLAEHAYGLYQKSSFNLLRLNSSAHIEQTIPAGSSEFKKLDVSALQYLILNKLGVQEKDLIYVKDEDEAMKMVDEDRAEFVFFLNPVKINQLRTIASGGERMPPKSTYFYPKLLSGVVINKFSSLD